MDAFAYGLALALSHHAIRLTEPAGRLDAYGGTTWVLQPYITGGR